MTFGLLFVGLWHIHSVLPTDSNAPDQFKTNPPWGCIDGYICFLYNVCAALEKDNCVDLKLAMTLVLRCVPFCAGHKIEPIVFNESVNGF